ncbi:hypothetical protein KCP71_18875 [Salmonella enterica subsp. enterica]|nr:hypothetical protein KCP71_18875 [Salmonella enterica subsp. enterica]
MRAGFKRHTGIFNCLRFCWSSYPVSSAEDSTSKRNRSARASPPGTCRKHRCSVARIFVLPTSAGGYFQAIIRFKSISEMA